MRVGIGYDVHKLVLGEDLILGGVVIDYEYGLKGHSDADVLIHGIMDALLGAAALGDIGRHFPDDDSKYKDISSIKLLEEVRDLIKNKGYEIINVDAVVIAQKPKISSYICKMIDNISSALNVGKNAVNIKATTTEKLGFVGKGQGISCQAIALINENN